jgi:hypothetical protein
MSAKPQHTNSGRLRADQDDYQNALEKSAAEFFDQHPESPNLFIVHLMYGGMVSDPGAIRKSAIRARNCFLSGLGELWKTQQIKNGKQDLDETDVNRQHAEVLRQHIRYLDRKNTFLNLMEGLIDKYEVEQVVFIFKQRENWEDYRLEIQRGSITLGARESIQIECEYSRRFADSLMPQYLSNEYFSNLYTNDDAIADRRDDGDEADVNNWRTGFILGRAEIFGMTTTNDVQKKALDQLYGDELDEKEVRIKFWNLLGELQSALLYFRGAGNAELASGTEVPNHVAPVGTVIAERLRGQPKSPRDFESPTAITVLSPSAPSASEVSINMLDTVVRIQQRDMEQQEVVNTVCKYTNPTFKDPDMKDIFKSTVKQIFKLRYQQRQLECISLWMAWLIEKLHNSVHEGHSLDFWLVAGDQTEFEGLAIPESDFQAINFEERATRAARALEREHFPWFQRGRYALFWDAGREKYAPTGIVGIKGSNWEQVLTEIYKPEPSLKIPVCCIAYSTGLPKEAGVIIHRDKTSIGQPTNEQTLQKNPFATIIRWRKKQWQLSIDPRKDKLLTALIEYLGSSTTSNPGTTLDEIADICLSVADNPHAGGIIVIVKEDKESVNDPDQHFQSLFAQMGKAWTIDDTREDRVALISHDGATLVALSSKNWGYRFLLSPDGVESEVRKGLVQCALGSNNNFPLTGVGSRRWSAALSAFKKEIGAVIVISQDGDIQFWASKNGGLEESMCLYLPQAGPERRIYLAAECSGKQ